MKSPGKLLKLTFLNTCIFQKLRVPVFIGYMPIFHVRTLSQLERDMDINSGCV